MNQQRAALILLCALVALTGCVSATPTSRINAVAWGTHRLGSAPAPVAPYPFIPLPLDAPSYIGTTAFGGEDIAQILELPLGRRYSKSVGTLTRTVSNKLYFTGWIETGALPLYGMLVFDSPLLLNLSSFLSGDEIIFRVAATNPNSYDWEPTIYIVLHNTSAPAQNWDLWSFRVTSPGTTAQKLYTFTGRPLDLQCSFSVCVVITAQRQPLVWGSDPYSAVFHENAHLIGDGTSPTSTVDPAVTPLAYTNGTLFGATQVALGATHALTLESSDGVNMDTIVSWGLNVYGQLGTNGFYVHSNNVTFPGVVFTQIAAGAYHSMLLDSTGHVHVFGRNDRSQLSAGYPLDTLPGNIVSLQTSFFGVSISKIFAYGDTSFALTSDNRFYSWGSNMFPLLDSNTDTSKRTLWYSGGMLGNGDRVRLGSDIPTLVQLPAGVQQIIELTPTPICNEDCTIFLLVNQSLTTPSPPPPPPASPPPANVVLSFASPAYPGNSDYTSLMPGPVSIVDLPATGNYVDTAWSYGMCSVLDASTNSVWFWGKMRQGFSIGVPIAPWNTSFGAHEFSQGVNVPSNASTAAAYPADLLYHPVNSKIHGNDQTSYNWFGFATNKGIGVDMATNEVRVHGGPTLELSDCSGPCPTIVSVSTGITHMVALLSNGSAVTWDFELEALAVATTFSHLCQGSGSGGSFGPVLALANITSVAAGNYLTVFAASVLGEDVIYTCGSSSTDAVLGNDLSQSLVPTTINSSELATPIHTVKKIVAADRRVLVLETNGRVLGWNQTNRIEERYAPYAPELNGLIVDISALSLIDYFLTEHGSVYAYGTLDRTTCPWFSPFGIPPILIGPAIQLSKLNLNIVDGTYYKITKLFQASAQPDGMGTEFSAPLLLLATAVGPIGSESVQNTPIFTATTPGLNAASTAATVTRELRAFGDNSFAFGAPYVFGFGSAYPRQVEPAKILPNQRKRQLFVAGSENDQFPFEIATAEFFFDSDVGYAITPEGKLYGWGRVLHEFNPNTDEAFTYQPSPVLLASDVGVNRVQKKSQLLSIYNDGYIYIDTQGQPQFAQKIEPSNWLSLRSDMLPTGDWNVTGVHCHWVWCLFSRISTHTGVISPTLVGSSFESGNMDLASPLAGDVEQFFLNNGDPQIGFEVANYLLLNRTSGEVRWAVSERLDLSNGEPTLFPNVPGFNPLPSMAYIIDWTCASRHCLALVKSTPSDLFGTIYSWGHNSYGQASVVNVSQFLSVPTKALSSDYDGQIKSIGGFGETSFALHSDGTMLYWGVDNADLTSLDISIGSDIPFVKLNTYGVKVVSPPSGGAFERVFSSVCSPIFSMEKRKRANFENSSSDSKRSSKVSEEVQATYYSDPEAFRAFVQVSYSVIDCPQPPPLDPSTLPANVSLVCSWVSPTEKVWLIVGSLTTSESTPFIVTGDITIQGNLSTNGGLVLRASPSGKIAFVNVTGCATISAPITADLSLLSDKQLNAVAKSGTQKQVVLESSCALPADGNSLLTVKTSKEQCHKVKSSAETANPPNPARSSLTVIFNVSSGSCNNWWIILVSVIGGVIVIGAVVFLIAYSASPKLRAKINPYEGANT